VGLAEEEEEDRLVRVAELGQLVEELGQHPHEEGGEERRALAHVRKVEHGDDPAAVRRGADEVGDLQLGSPKNASPPSASSRDTWRSSTPAVAVEIPPIALRSAFPGR